MFIFGKHLVGDWKSNNIYEMKRPYQVNGQWISPTMRAIRIRRARRAPHISNEQKMAVLSELIIYLESGIGPVPPLQGFGPPSLLVLEDSNNVLRNVSILDNGQIQTAVTPTGTAQIVVLNDPVGNAWTVGIATIGKLTLTPHAAGSFPLSYSLQALQKKRNGFC